MAAFDDADAQTQSRLCALDDFLLALIFARSGYTRGYLTICKRISPVIDYLFHRAPALRSPDQLLSFCHHLEREPSRVREVNYLLIDAHCEFPVWNPPGAGLESPRGRRLQLPTGAELSELVELADEWVPPEFPSGRLVAGPALVQDLLRALPLHRLRVGNPPLATAVLTREFVESSPLQELARLDIAPYTRPDNELGRLFRLDPDKDPRSSEREHEHDSPSGPSQQDLAREFLASLCLLPSLKRLSFGALGWDLPVGFLNIDPPGALPPRSLRVERFALPSSFILPVEVCSLAAALAIGLTSFELDAIGLGGQLDDLVMRLPPTLRRLVVRIGRSKCPCIYDTSYSGAISAAALDLPNLVSLELKGDVVSPSTLAGIQRLEHLERLTLGEHTQYDLAALLALLPRPAPPDAVVPPSSPTTPPRPLRRLTLDICSCPPDDEDLMRSRPGTAPRWPSGFGAADARELLREAGPCGVVVEGPVRCAAGACEGSGEVHACHGWCRT
ncbi:uncharacterized protein RHOBADRAFT_44915 [Rhodotorula graminis WP1]|uniref:Uncharacterized protein n=1 Tax=Rhodotorula graminis (strain WP1) TaxID=578459 RepID=A0A194S1K8_RHOGW|nr:uncharacterized protein RHOBADRAFT_44915 [Rhodotorula graminis WP1]KPV74425.1 hypothetical protein RHOBADRAFT_44915 [Rhodotorula graminis WP1]